MVQGSWYKGSIQDISEGEIGRAHV
jgi:hypothetical protein